MATFVRRVIAVLAVGAAPSPLLAGWNVQVICNYSTVNPQDGCADHSDFYTSPTAYATKSACEAAAASFNPCPPNANHDVCIHPPSGSQKSCVGFDDFSLGGGGGGGNDGPTIQLPGSEFLPDGSLLTNSQFEQIAGGFHNMGDVALLGGEYGDAFFQSRYTESFQNWLGDMDRRLGAQLEETFRAYGMDPSKYPSLFSAGLPGTPPSTERFENTYLMQFYDPALQRIPNTNSLLLAAADQAAKWAVDSSDFLKKAADDPALMQTISQTATDAKAFLEEAWKDGRVVAEGAKQLLDKLPEGTKFVVDTILDKEKAEGDLAKEAQKIVPPGGKIPELDRDVAEGEIAGKIKDWMGAASDAYELFAGNYGKVIGDKLRDMITSAAPIGGVAKSTLDGGGKLLEAGLAAEHQHFDKYQKEWEALGGKGQLFDSRGAEEKVLGGQSGCIAKTILGLDCK